MDEQTERDLRIYLFRPNGISLVNYIKFKLVQQYSTYLNFRDILCTFISED